MLQCIFLKQNWLESRDLPSTTLCAACSFIISMAGPCGHDASFLYCCFSVWTACWMSRTLLAWMVVRLPEACFMRITVTLEYLTVEHCLLDRRSLTLSVEPCCCSHHHHHGRPPDVDPEMLVRTDLTLAIWSILLHQKPKDLRFLPCIWPILAASQRSHQAAGPTDFKFF